MWRWYSEHFAGFDKLAALYLELLLVEQHAFTSYGIVLQNFFSDTGTHGESSLYYPKFAFPSRSPFLTELRGGFSPGCGGELRGRSSTEVAHGSASRTQRIGRKVQRAPNGLGSCIRASK